jgi:hypothetical protein
MIAVVRYNLKTYGRHFTLLHNHGIHLELRISLKSNNTPGEHLSNSGDLTYRGCGEV